jgi:hypothetical protein
MSKAMAPGGVEPPVPVARLTIPGRTEQTRPAEPHPDDRKEVTMSTRRKAWLWVLQDADGREETELITIERNAEGTPPVIELTNGVGVTCTEPRARPEPRGLSDRDELARRRGFSPGSIECFR